MIAYIMGIAKLFLSNAEIKLSRALAFQANFVLSLLGNLVYSFIAPLFQLLIYQNTSGYPGWSPEDMLLFQAMLLFWIGLTETLFGDVRKEMADAIRQGNFDHFLLLPYPALAIIFGKGFSYRGLGTLLAGAISVVYFGSKSLDETNWWHYSAFIVYLITGLLFYVSLLIVFCTVAIKTVYVERLKEVMDRLVFFGNFPAQAFAGSLKTLYTIFLPMAIWVHYPAEALLGKADGWPVYAILMTLLFFASSILVWDYQLKKYTSAGG